MNREKKGRERGRGVMVTVEENPGCVIFHNT